MKLSDHSLSAKFRAFLSDDRGATAIEYAVIAAAIAGTVSALVYSLGNQISTTFYDKISALM